MIQDVDKIETRVDRKNLDADDSQRDILAQRLLQEAKKSLADHDSVAAISLATKASTLLEPLPKLAVFDPVRAIDFFGIVKELPFTIRKNPCIFMSLGEWPYTC